MQLIASRSYPFLDDQTLAERNAHDTLLRVGESEFLLYMTSDNGAEERLIRFDCRAALVWINQEGDEFGANWQ